MKVRRWTLALIFGGLLGTFWLGLAQGFSYPKDFRTWSHVKSMAIEPGHPLYETFGGLHHIYANARAMEGYRRNPLRFPDGSVIAFDLLEVKKGQNTLEEGSRKLTGFMVKNRARYAETGGWGYFAFGPDGKPLAIDPKACYACHQGVANSDYVFSRYRP